MAKVKRKLVYVLYREHYHFPPKESDMVGVTMLRVYPGHDTGRISAKMLARTLATEHQRRNTAQNCGVKEHTSNTREYRVWVECWDNDRTTDRFVWVVREVEYVSG